jgi:hypothetical protein
VPLGDGDSVACVYCRAQVQVPEAHRALRAAEREYNQHRDVAHRLLRRLGKPPSALIRFLTNAHGGTVIWLVTLGALLSGALCAALFSLAGRLSLAWFHVHLDDVVLYRYDQTALFVVGQFAFLLAGLGLLVVLGAYTRRRGVGLRELQAGLSARRPESTGGPATCRECGAPLRAEAGELAVTCGYCRTDNLLRIPESWIGAARARGRKLAGAVEDAVLSFEDEERSIRRSLLLRLAVVGFISSSSLFLLIGVTEAATLERTTVTPYQRLEGRLYRFDWKEAVESPSLTLDMGEIQGCKGLSCAPSLNEVPCAERRDSGPLVVPAGACDADVCILHFYVALRRGDAIEVSASGFPHKSFIVLESHVPGEPFHEDPAAWGTQVPGAFAWLVEGKPTRLSAAPHDGWFMLMLALGEAVPGAPLDFCARLERTAAVKK